MQEMRGADVAASDRVPRLLDERIAPVVERDGGDDARASGLLDKLLRLGSRHRQGLVGDDVLSFASAADVTA